MWLFFEFAIHVVRDCGIAHVVWNFMIPKQCKNIFYNLELKEWMH